MAIRLSKLKEKQSPEDSLFDEAMEFARQYVSFADDLIPAPLCSIGAHIGNTRQQEHPFFYVDGMPEDIRLSITFVAPSGLSKSYPMKFFVHKQYGLCPIMSTFRGKITEAGFVGTIKDGDEIRGDAWDYRNGIVAFNEISNIFMTALQEHSPELINQVMEALSEGSVSKRLGTGVMSYPTGVTIWGATQPKRFDFSQGLARRFLFVSRNWTQADLDHLKKKRKQVRGEDGSATPGIKKLNIDHAHTIKEKIDTVAREFCAEDLIFKGGIQDYIDEMTDTHLQMTVIEHAIIGATVIDKPTDKTLEVDDSTRNRQLVKMFVQMQNMVSEGSDVSLMASVLSELGKVSDKARLWDRFKKFSYTLENFNNLLEQCLRLGVIIKRYPKEGGPVQYVLKRKL